MRIFILLALIPILTGCNREAHERHYQEIVVEAPASDVSSMSFSNDPHAGLRPQPGSSMPSDLLWDVPSGWTQEPASVMRVATFKSIDDPQAIDVSIVSLGGMAGGVEANLRRWAGQIHLNLEEAALKEFIKSARLLTTQTGQEAQLFDFTMLQKGQDASTKSTLAAMIQWDDMTVFVKMTGSIEEIRKNQPAFEQLTSSIRRQ